MLKIAIDTNTLFSAIVYRGSCRQLLKLAEEYKIRIGVPEYCLLELRSVLYDKFGQEKCEEYYTSLVEWINDYADLIVKPRNNQLNKYLDLIDDIWDVPVIASAHMWAPDYFITGDKKLSQEKVGKLLKISTVAEILNMFKETTEQA